MFAAVLQILWYPSHGKQTVNTKQRKTKVTGLCKLGRHFKKEIPTISSKSLSFRDKLWWFESFPTAKASVHPGEEPTSSDSSLWISIPVEFSPLLMFIFTVHLPAKAVPKYSPSRWVGRYVRKYFGLKPNHEVRVSSSTDILSWWWHQSKGQVLTDVIKNHFKGRDECLDRPLVVETVCTVPESSMITLTSLFRSLLLQWNCISTRSIGVSFKPSASYDAPAAAVAQTLRWITTFLTLACASFWACGGTLSPPDCI